MAIKDLKKHWKQDLSAATKKFDKYAQSLGSNTLVEFDLNFISMVVGALKGTSLVIEGIADKPTKDGMHKMNTKQVWSKIVKEKFEQMKKEREFGNNRIKTYKASRTPLPGSGVYFGQAIGSIKKGFSLVIWDTDPKEIDDIIEQAVVEILDDLWSRFNKLMFKEGYAKNIFGEQKTTGASSTTTRGGGATTARSRFRQGLKKQHGTDSTKAKFALETEQMFRDSEIGISTKITTKGIDLHNYIMSNLKVDWNQIKVKKKYANYNATSVLKLSLGVNKDLKTDVNKIMDLITPYIEREVKESGLLGQLAKNSISIKKQIELDVVNDTVQQIVQMYATGRITKGGNLDMRFKKNKSALKAFTEERNAQLAKPKGGKGGVISGAVAVKKLQKSKKMRPQKQKREDTQNVFSVQRLINKRLPAEVRRNMGRPALRNQTGRFSNSVKMENIRQSKMGLTADYTYMLSPYETFENTGRRTWPNGYNPKNLIKKSIRNLALQYTEQKFTQLRRN
jgi:hypothetical protein|tara:strand:- start:12954 stop:14477 length:1524 start_codon:yes stop_codon:yes gene_type:complete